MNIAIYASQESMEMVKAVVNDHAGFRKHVSINHLNQLDTYTYDQQECLQIDKDIYLLPHWLSLRPPYLLPCFECNELNLTRILQFSILGDSSESLSQSDTLSHYLKIFGQIRKANIIDLKTIAWLEKIDDDYHLALINQFGLTENSRTDETIIDHYLKALIKADDSGEKRFILNQTLEFLRSIEAVDLIAQLLDRFKEDIAAAPPLVFQILLQKKLYLDMVNLSSHEHIKTLIRTLTKSFNFFENVGMDHFLPPIYLQRAELYQYAEQYPQALEEVNAGIKTYRKLNAEYDMASASLTKARILYSWSKKGQPQYYKPSINALQNSLKVLKLETYPLEYGDVQCLLAVIYAEMPTQNLAEKNIWAAFSASAYEEALKVYTYQTFPYQYATICSNYGTSLLNFSEGKTRKNLKKAAEMFEKALKVRNPETYPLERALTLLNQLELYWKLHNDNTDKEHQRLETMQNSIKEIRQLVPPDKTDILKVVARHEQDLETLVNLE